MIRSALLVALAAIALVWLSLAGLAQPVSDGDRAEFQRIIADQIAAFNGDDGERAYGHAAPAIKQLFPTPEIFMSMVKRGYPPVYRQQSYTFGEVTTEGAGRPTQRVTIVDVAGKLWTALYSFEKQPDGSWKIIGCTLVELPAADA